MRGDGQGNEHQCVSEDTHWRFRDVEEIVEVIALISYREVANVTD